MLSVRELLKRKRLLALQVLKIAQAVALYFVSIEIFKRDEWYLPTSLYIAIGHGVIFFFVLIFQRRILRSCDSRLGGKTKPIFHLLTCKELYDDFVSMSSSVILIFALNTRASGGQRIAIGYAFASGVVHFYLLVLDWQGAKMDAKSASPLGPALDPLDDLIKNQEDSPADAGIGVDSRESEYDTFETEP